MAGRLSGATVLYVAAGALLLGFVGFTLLALLVLSPLLIPFIPLLLVAGFALAASVTAFATAVAAGALVLWWLSPPFRQRVTSAYRQARELLSEAWRKVTASLRFIRELVSQVLKKVMELVSVVEILKSVQQKLMGGPLSVIGDLGKKLNPFNIVGDLGKKFDIGRNVIGYLGKKLDGAGSSLIGDSEKKLEEARNPLNIIGDVEKKLEQAWNPLNIIGDVGKKLEHKEAESPLGIVGDVRKKLEGGIGNPLSVIGDVGQKLEGGGLGLLGGRTLLHKVAAGQS